MKKFMNEVGNILTESLHGFASAHQDILTVDPSGKIRLACSPRAVLRLPGVHGSPKSVTHSPASTASRTDAATSAGRLHLEGGCGATASFGLTGPTVPRTSFHTWRLGSSKSRQSESMRS